MPKLWLSSSMWSHSVRQGCIKRQLIKMVTVVEHITTPPKKTRHTLWFSHAHRCFSTKMLAKTWNWIVPFFFFIPPTTLLLDILSNKSNVNSSFYTLFSGGQREREREWVGVRSSSPMCHFMNVWININVNIPEKVKVPDHRDRAALLKKLLKWNLV